MTEDTQSSVGVGVGGRLEWTFARLSVRPWGWVHGSVSRSRRGKEGGGIGLSFPQFSRLTPAWGVVSGVLSVPWLFLVGSFLLFRSQLTCLPQSSPLSTWPHLSLHLTFSLAHLPTNLGS